MAFDALPGKSSFPVISYHAMSVEQLIARAPDSLSAGILQQLQRAVGLKAMGILKIGQDFDRLSIDEEIEARNKREKSTADWWRELRFQMLFESVQQFIKNQQDDVDKTLDKITKNINDIEGRKRKPLSKAELDNLKATRDSYRRYREELNNIERDLEATRRRRNEEELRRTAERAERAARTAERSRPADTTDYSATPPPPRPDRGTRHSSSGSSDADDDDGSEHDYRSHRRSTPPTDDGKKNPDKRKGKRDDDKGEDDSSAPAPADP